MFTDLKDNILLRLVNLPGQAAVGDGIDDDWLVGLGAWFLEEFRTYDTQTKPRRWLNFKYVSSKTLKINVGSVMVRINQFFLGFLLTSVLI